MEKQQQSAIEKSKVESRKSKVYRLLSSVFGPPPSSLPCIARRATPGSSALQLARHSSQSDAWVYSLRSAVCSPRRRQAAFTLIELLVAMSLLMIIVLMLANLFQQSTRAWDSGLRQAEIGLEARAAINILQQDLSRAVCPTGGTFISTSFDMLNDSATNLPAIQHVVYSSSGGRITRRVDDGKLAKLVEAADLTLDVKEEWSDGSSGPGLPDYVDITLSLTSSKNFSEVRVFAKGHAYDDSTVSPTDVIDTTSRH